MILAENCKSSVLPNISSEKKYVFDIDINAQGDYFGSALQAASAGGYSAVVRTVLHNGASVNQQGGYYGNALQAASASCDWETVELLLSHGADINAQGGEFGTAL